MSTRKEKFGIGASLEIEAGSPIPVTCDLFGIKTEAGWDGSGYIHGIPKSSIRDFVEAAEEMILTLYGGRVYKIHSDGLPIGTHIPFVLAEDFQGF